ncbi:MAG: PAS-domain containing protein, partial [Roseibium sp.]
MPFSADIVINESYETYPDPVLVTNGDGIIVAANPAATTALGYAQRELLGMDLAVLGICRNDNLGPAEKSSASEDKNRRLRRKASLHGKDGRALSVEISRRLLSDNDTPPTGALMIIRELETPSGGLAEQLGSDQFLKSALDSVSYGFAIFDQADRLVLCNNAYRDMHAAFTPVIQPGKTFEEMLREAIETDQFPESGSTPTLRETWIEQRLAKHDNPVAPFVLQVNPNKWIQVEDRVTADNYRVGMRADVTALMRAKSEAERLGFILDGVAQEVYLVNPKNRSIIYANKSARDNLQYSMDELRSLDARRLNADFSPDELSERLKPLLSGKAKVLSLDTRHRR